MAGVAKLFNGRITDKSNKEVDLNDEKYKEKVIGLYFSAHWCPPCRGFTPVLTQFYNQYHDEKNLEIIFISGDNDEESFNDYYKEMPWLALDYKERNKGKKLSDKFHVAGIPTLVLLDGDTGDMICNDARDQIQDEDKQGEKFPWKTTNKRKKSFRCFFCA